MKERILTNWTFARALYLIIGIAVIIQSVMSHQWFGVAFGCASGNCFGGSCATEPKQKSIATIQDVEFEEVKTK